MFTLDCVKCGATKSYTTSKAYNRALKGKGLCAPCARKLPMPESARKTIGEKNHARAEPQEYLVLGAVTWIVIRTKDGKTERARTQIDTSDAERCREKRWYYNPKTNRVSGTNSDSEPLVYLYRFLTDCPDELDVDHVNGDRMDNRRSNLRIVTTGENNENMKSHADGTSGYRNVYWNTRKNCWYACVLKNKKQYTRFCATKEEAIEAAKELRAKHFTHNVEDRHS